MKLRISTKKLTWPLFRAWWNGIWFGLMLGIFAGAWFGRSRWIDTPLVFIILPACGFIAEIPYMVTQLSQGVRRYRDAAKRQPHI